LLPDAFITQQEFWLPPRRAALATFGTCYGPISVLRMMAFDFFARTGFFAVFGSVFTPHSFPTRRRHSFALIQVHVRAF
jgi:hypothetical protein